MTYSQEYVYVLGSKEFITFNDWISKLSDTERTKYTLAERRQRQLITQEVTKNNLTEEFSTKEFGGWESAYRRIWVSKEACDAFKNDAVWEEIHNQYLKESDQILDIRIIT